MNNLRKIGMVTKFGRFKNFQTGKVLLYIAEFYKMQPMVSISKLFYEVLVGEINLKQKLSPWLLFHMITENELMRSKEWSLV